MTSRATILDYGTLTIAMVTSVSSNIALAMSGQSLQSGTVLFIYSASMLVFALPFMTLSSNAWRTVARICSNHRQLMPHCFRAITTYAAQFTFVYALSAIQFATALALVLGRGFLVIIIGHIFLGERLQTRHLVSISIGLGGMLIILAPTFQGSPLGTGAAVLSGFLSAGVIVQTKSISRSVRPLPATFLLALGMVSISLAWTSPTWTWPEVAVLSWVCLAALLALITYTALSAAYAHLPLLAIATFDLTYVLISSATGFIILGQSPTIATIAGGTLIAIASTICVSKQMISTQRSEG